MKNAGKYARMFLNAVGKDGAEKAIADLTVASELFDKSPDFKSLLKNPAFTKEDRTKGIAAVSKSAGFSDHTAKFLAFLADNKEAAGLAKVLDRVITIHSESVNKVLATVISPTDIGTQYDARIKASLAGITGKDVEIAHETDPSLLGGLLIKVGSQMFDSSIQGQLRLLKDELIKG